MDQIDKHAKLAADLRNAVTPLSVALEEVGEARADDTIEQAIERTMTAIVSLVADARDLVPKVLALAAEAEAIAPPAPPACEGTFLLDADERSKRRREWVEDFALNCDLFRTSYCGYWAFGQTYEFDGERANAWLVWESPEGRTRSEVEVDADEVSAAFEHDLATSVAHAVSRLPKGWYHLDRAAAERAYAIGERKWGEDWTGGPHGDASGYDCVVQAALLGEVRYG